MKYLKTVLLGFLLGGSMNMHAQVPEGADEILREEFGYPPKRDDFLISLDESEEPNQYVLGVFEGAEQYLGTETFYKLEKLFSGVNGVEGVHQDDREIFIINSKEKDREKLLNDLWGKFLEAAKMSFGK